MLVEGGKLALDVSCGLECSLLWLLLSKKLLNKALSAWGLRRSLLSSDGLEGVLETRGRCHHWAKALKHTG